MKRLEIQNIPNQVFTVTLEGENYRVAIRTMQGLSFMSVWKNEDILFYNQICVPNGYVNPYNYISAKGKFFFKCLDNNYPNYRFFGDTQFLLFLTKEEVEQNAEA